MKKSSNLLLFVLALFLTLSSSLSAASQMPEAFLFDFGGVMAQAKTKGAIDLIQETFNVPWHDAETAYFGFKEDIFRRGDPKEYWQHWADSHQLTLPPNWLENYSRAYSKSVVFFPEMVELVKELQAKGYTTALISNISGYHAQLMRNVGNFDLFYPVILSGDIGTRKPDLKAFKIAIETLDVPPSKVLFIDDSKMNVQAAKKAGMDAILFTTPEELFKELRGRGFDLEVLKDYAG